MISIDIYVIFIRTIFWEAKEPHYDFLYLLLNMYSLKKIHFSDLILFWKIIIGKKHFQWRFSFFKMANDDTYPTLADPVNQFAMVLKCRLA